VEGVGSSQHLTATPSYVKYVLSLNVEYNLGV